MGFNTAFKGLKPQFEIDHTQTQRSGNLQAANPISYATQPTLSK